MVKTKKEVTGRQPRKVPATRAPSHPEPWGGFYENASLEELARRQGVKPLSSLKDLAIPELADEKIDELLAILREIRGH